MTVLREKKGGWWTAQLGDKTGSVPYNYVQRLEDGAA